MLPFVETDQLEIGLLSPYEMLCIMIKVGNTCHYISRVIVLYSHAGRGEHPMSLFSCLSVTAEYILINFCLNMLNM